jgi:hypothetical protein
MLVCPECADAGVERVFETAQKLGVHRFRSHGVKGTSRPSRNGASTSGGAKQEPKAESGKRREGTGKRDATSRKRGARGRKSVSTAPVAKVTAFPTDKVLQAVFPHGITASGEMLGRVQEWLGEGEKLFAAAKPANGKK